MKNKLTVLFTWEIGQGFGHVLPLLPMARAFKAQGHTVVFALRDVRSAGAMLRSEGFQVLQAPFHPDQFFPADAPQPQSMADILAIFGFSNVQHLSGLTAAWQCILALCQPDLVVASYAPLSLLCARQAGIATLLMALPFELPANVHPSPVLRTGLAPSHSTMDDAVVNTVNAVFGAQTIASVHGVFQAQASFMMSFAELDFFGPRAQVSYCGSFFVTDVGAAPHWPAGPGGKVFAYLNSELPHLDLLRQAIHASSQRYCIVLRDASPALLDAWRAPNVWVSSEVMRLDLALAQCDAVLCHGGAGTVSASLLAGKPLVFYVRHLEPHLNAQQVVKLGAGLLPQPPTSTAVAQALDEVLANPRYTQAAQRFASRYTGHSQTAVAKHIVATALQLCQGRLEAPVA